MWYACPVAYIKQRSRKDGTPYWQVRFTLDGRQSAQSFSAANGPGAQEEAERFCALVNSLNGDAARALEIWGLATAPITHGGVTVAEWLDRHVDHLTGMEAQTLKLYRAYIDNDIRKPLGSIPLTSLTHEDVANWLNQLGGSAKTIANKHGFLSGALNVAVKKNQIPHNPCEGIKLPRGERREIAFLSPQEYQILKKSVTEHWQPFVEFLVASGCRFSEATALRPADVDRTAGTVRISRARKRGGQIGAPKTRMGVRTINVDPMVLEQLDYSRPWLFTGRAGPNWRQPGDNPVLIGGFHERVWRPAVERSGLAKRPRIHDLRHTCASWMIAAGVPLPVIQRHLGHESIQTTIDVYGHLDRTLSQVAASAVASALKI